MPTLFRWTAVGRSEVGLVRRENQDAWLADAVLGLAAVADGISALPASAKVSRWAIDWTVEGWLARQGRLFPEMARESFPAEVFERQSALSPNPVVVPDGAGGAEVEAVLREAVADAHRRAVAAGREINAVRGVGTTLDFVAFQGRWATWAHVGDGHLWLKEPDCSLFEPLTVEHHEPGHLAAVVLANYVGQSAPLRVDTGQRELRLGQRWLLLTDGITKHLDLEEVSQLSAARVDGAAFADSLIQTCLSRGGFDNLTVVVVEIHPTPSLTGR